MKWRSPLAYLLMLLLVGGYYFYFEVIQKKQQEMAAKEARKVFHFQADGVNAVTLSAKGRDVVQLEKEEHWQIIAPIKSEADNFSVQDLIGALSNLEAEREVIAVSGDLKPFGLIEPSLTIRFHLGEQQHELLVGDKNPIGDGSYAKTADTPRVFLIAEGNRSALNRGLDDLRKRQLFTFQLDQVAGIEVAWRDGNATVLEFASAEKQWKAAANPELRIKKSKVDNLIEQVHWLRAQGFLENEPKDLSTYGLEPPMVTVTVQLKSGEKAELKLAEKKQNDQGVAALSSHLPAVVQVATSILDDLPRNLQKLLDRSILGFKPDEIKEVTWILKESRGHVVRFEGDQWGLRKGDQQPEPLKESWPVRSLLWDLGDAEYQQELDPSPRMGASPWGRIELRNAAKGLLLILSWEKAPQLGSNAVPVWLEREGETAAVSVDAETVRRLEGDLERVIGEVQQVQ